MSNWWNKNLKYYNEKFDVTDIYFSMLICVTESYYMTYWLINLP